MAKTDFLGGSSKATHLCVLVHGLWGEPEHMHSIARAVREKHPNPEDLYILCARSNRGMRTYDGVEHGGERVCHEIETTLKSIEEDGGKITQLSVIGYSLGGLISRYVVGLLEAKGRLQEFECMTFATFASPHLGANIPGDSKAARTFNSVVPPAISAAGQHLFLRDEFRDTSRPLLAVMADPKSVFIRALTRFRRLTAYGNIVDDRAVPYYTAAMTAADPFADLSHVNVAYEDGYTVVLQRNGLVTEKSDEEKKALQEHCSEEGKRDKRAKARKVGLGVTAAVLSPILIPVIAAYTTAGLVGSKRRMKMHDEGKRDVDTKAYRELDLWAPDTASETDTKADTLASSTDDATTLPSDTTASDTAPSAGTSTSDLAETEEKPATLPQVFPALDLLTPQLDMVDGLATLPWRKYPVWIRDHINPHEDVVVRRLNSVGSEGQEVIRHFVTQEFLTA